MRFDLDMGEGSNQIKGYTAGQIKVNDEIYTHAVIVAPDVVLTLECDHLDHLTPDILQQLLNLKPDVVLFGSGDEPYILPKTSLLFFHQHNVGVEVMTTAAACRTYNVIMAEGRRVVAALLV